MLQVGSGSGSTPDTPAGPQGIGASSSLWSCIIQLLGPGEPKSSAQTSLILSVGLLQGYKAREGAGAQV